MSALRLITLNWQSIIDVRCIEVPTQKALYRELVSDPVNQACSWFGWLLGRKYGDAWPFSRPWRRQGAGLSSSPYRMFMSEEKNFCKLQKFWREMIYWGSFRFWVEMSKMAQNLNFFRNFSSKNDFQGLVKTILLVGGFECSIRRILSTLNHWTDSKYLWKVHLGTNQ